MKPKIIVSTIIILIVVICMSVMGCLYYNGHRNPLIVAGFSYLLLSICIVWTSIGIGEDTKDDYPKYFWLISSGILIAICIFLYFTTTGRMQSAIEVGVIPPAINFILAFMTLLGVQVKMRRFYITAFFINLRKSNAKSSISYALIIKNN